MSDSISKYYEDNEELSRQEDLDRSSYSQKVVNIISLFRELSFEENLEIRRYIREH